MGEHSKAEQHCTWCKHTPWLSTLYLCRCFKLLYNSQNSGPLATLPELGSKKNRDLKFEGYCPIWLICLQNPQKGPEAKESVSEVFSEKQKLLQDIIMPHKEMNALLRFFSRGVHDCSSQMHCTLIDNSQLDLLTKLRTMAVLFLSTACMMKGSRLITPTFFK